MTMAFPQMLDAWAIDAPKSPLWMVSRRVWRTDTVARASQLLAQALVARGMLPGDRVGMRLMLSWSCHRLIEVKQNPRQTDTGRCLWIATITCQRLDRFRRIGKALDFALNVVPAKLRVSVAGVARQHAPKHQGNGLIVVGHGSNR